MLRHLSANGAATGDVMQVISVNPTAREIAIAAFYSDSHPLLDRYIAANGINADQEGYGVDLYDFIAFVGLLPPEDLQ
jgi:hypothetical protein